MDGKLLFKLMRIQQKLKAPKGQYNSFGKYPFRSAEDILEAVKPLCHAENTLPLLSDEVVSIDGRWYVKATAILYDCETGHDISVTALARESEDKKGMDESQQTGCASSYARKYAMNGLYAIDDTKDADTNEYHKSFQKHESSPVATAKLAGGETTPDERVKLTNLFNSKDANGKPVFTKEEIEAFKKSRVDKTAAILIGELEKEVKSRTSFNDDEIPFL